MVVVLVVVIAAFVVNSLLAAAVGQAAERKSRNYQPWFWIAFFVPILSAFAVACMAESGGVSTAPRREPLPAKPAAAPVAPPVSPDGRFWWDGSKWHRMPDA